MATPAQTAFELRDIFCTLKKTAAQLNSLSPLLLRIVLSKFKCVSNRDLKEVATVKSATGMKCPGG